MKTKDILVALFFLVTSFCIFLPMFISDKLFCWLDFVHYFKPFRELTAAIIKNGNVPLWNPYIFCGNPLMANMQSAVFYPLNILYYVLPFTLAVKIQTLLAFFIASFSMYALARSYKASRLAAMLAGSVFAFGFYITVRAVEMADLHVIIWIPAIILLAKKYVSLNRSFDLFLLILCLAMSFLGGHPQVFSYAFILFTAFYFFEASDAGISIAESFKKYMMINGIFAVFIMVQLAPTLEFIFLSKRTTEGVGANVHLSTFAGIEQVVSFFFPFLAGRLGRDALFIDWMALVDIGIPSVLLFISGAVLMKKGRLKIFLIWLFAAAALTAFVGNFKIYQDILLRLPFLGAVEYVSKINIICVIIIALLVSFGFDALINGCDEKNERKNIMKLFLMLTCIIVTAWILLYVFQRQAGMYYVSVITAQKAAGDFNEFLKDVNIYVVLLLSFVFTLLLLASRRLSPKIAGYAVFGLAFAAIFSYHIAGYDFYAKEWAFFNDTENIQKLKNEPGIYSTRILAPYLSNKPDYTISAQNNEASVYYLKDSLFPNVPMQAHLLNADGFDSLQIASFCSLTKKIRSLETPWDNPAFSLLSAEYIVAQTKIKGKYIKLFLQGYSNIYKYSKAMPLVYFIPTGSGINITYNEKVIIEGITAGAFDPKKQLFLEEKAAKVFKTMKPGNPVCKVAFSRENSNNLTIRTEAGADGFIVVNDNYYPGWEARVNGQKTEIYRANHTFKAIPVRKGNNEIRLVYDPRLFKVSLLLSILGLLAAAGYFALRAKNYSQKVL